MYNFSVSVIVLSDEKVVGRLQGNEKVVAHKGAL